MRKIKSWGALQREALDRIMNSTVDDATKELNTIYARASFYLKQKNSNIFDVYVNRFGLTEAQARFLLNNLDDEPTLQKALERLKQIDLESLEAIDILQKLDAPAYRYRIARLEEQMKNVDDLMKRIGATEGGINHDAYIDVANQSYNVGMYNMQQMSGYEFKFNGISEQAVEHIIGKNWSGVSYLERIYNNKSALGRRIKEEMIVAFLTGKSEMEIAYQLDNEFEKGLYESRRLVATESCRIYNDVILYGYEELGIDRYVYLAVHDAITSKTCRKLDRQVFFIAEAEEGKNLPPMHPWCRSVTGPYYETNEVFKRRAYNPEKGKYEYVDKNENYFEWQKRVGAY